MVNIPNNTSQFIYLVHAKGTNRYKIGLTGNVSKRLKQLNGKQSPFPLTLVHQVEVKNMHFKEKILHRKFDARRTHGEWFIFESHEIANVTKAMDEHRLQQRKTRISLNWSKIATLVGVGSVLLSLLIYCSKTNNPTFDDCSNGGGGKACQQYLKYK